MKSAPNLTSMITVLSSGTRGNSYPGTSARISESHPSSRSTSPPRAFDGSPTFRNKQKLKAMSVPEGGPGGRVAALPALAKVSEDAEDKGFFPERLSLTVRLVESDDILAHVEVRRTSSLALLRQTVALAVGLSCPLRLSCGSRNIAGISTVQDAGLEEGDIIEVTCGSPTVITASTDFLAMLWSPAGGKSSLTFEGHTNQVMSASYSPDGQLVATASTDNTARIWCGDSGDCLYELKGHKGPVYTAAFSPDGRLIVTASHDRLIKLWNAHGGQFLKTLKGHTRTVHMANFSPDGATVLSASDDGTAKIWDSLTGACLWTIDGHSGPVYGANFSPDGALVVTASCALSAKMWRVAKQELEMELSGHTEWLRSAAFSPDGKWVATTSGDSSARLWDAQSGTCIHTLTGHTDWLRSAAFSDDSKLVATASKDGTAKIWSTETGDCVTTLDNGVWVRCVAFSPGSPSGSASAAALSFCTELALHGRGLGARAIHCELCE